MSLILVFIEVGPLQQSQMLVGQIFSGQMLPVQMMPEQMSLIKEIQETWIYKFGQTREAFYDRWSCWFGVLTSAWTSQNGKHSLFSERFLFLEDLPPKDTHKYFPDFMNQVQNVSHNTVSLEYTMLLLPLIMLELEFPRRLAFVCYRICFTKIHLKNYS